MEDAGEGVAAAPGLVQHGFGTALGVALDALAEGLEMSGELGQMYAISEPIRSQVWNGHLLLEADIIIGQFPGGGLTLELIDATCDFKSQRFIEYTLSNDRVYRADELVRYINRELITVPGYHTVLRTKGQLLLNLSPRSEYKEQLEQKQVSADLRGAFENDEISLSNQACVKQTDERNWYLLDGEASYRIKEASPITTSDESTVHTAIYPRSFIRTNPDEVTRNNPLSLYAVEEEEEE